MCVFSYLILILFVWAAQSIIVAHESALLALHCGAFKGVNNIDMFSVATVLYTQCTSILQPIYDTMATGAYNRRLIV